MRDTHHIHKAQFSSRPLDTNTTEIEVELPQHMSGPLNAFVDSGASDSFITQRLVQRLGIIAEKIKKPRELILFDGRKAPGTLLSEYVVLATQITQEITFNIEYIVLSRGNSSRFSN